MSKRPFTLQGPISLVPRPRTADAAIREPSGTFKSFLSRTSSSSTHTSPNRSRSPTPGSSTGFNSPIFRSSKDIFSKQNKKSPKQNIRPATSEATTTFLPTSLLPRRRPSTSDAGSPSSSTTGSANSSFELVEIEEEERLSSWSIKQKVGFFTRSKSTTPSEEKEQVPVETHFAQKRDLMIQPYIAPIKSRQSNSTSLRPPPSTNNSFYSKPRAKNQNPRNLRAPAIRIGLHFRESPTCIPRTLPSGSPSSTENVDLNCCENRLSSTLQ